MLNKTKQEHPAALRGIKRLLDPAPTFNVSMINAPERPKVERYISDQFKKAHDADLKSFMPLLFTMNCGSTLSAAVGIRPTSTTPLFLEQYLTRPIEEILSPIDKSWVERGSVVEIGNLVASHRGASQLLFMILTAVLHQANFQWVVFTATPQVQKTLRRLGLELHCLGDADPSQLIKSDMTEWGSYYDCQPKVVASKIPDGMSTLEQRTVIAALLSLFKKRTAALSTVIHQQRVSDDVYCYAA